MLKIFKKQLRLEWLIPMFVVVAVFGMVQYVNAQYWVDDPANCPAIDETNYPGQNCDDEMICGDLSGIAQCYDTSFINAPTASTTSNANYSSSYDGGYILNCFATDSSPDPYCNNNNGWWCDRDSECYDVNRNTVCVEDLMASSTCGTCRSGYRECDGSYTDIDGCEIDIGDTPYPGEADAHYHSNGTCTAECDIDFIDCNIDLGTGGDGCEVEDQVSCYFLGLPGTIQGCNGCILDPVNFQTGVEAKFSTTSPLLWGTQYGTGPLFELTNYNASTTGGVFYVGNDGKVGIGTTSPSAMLTIGLDTGSQFLVNATGTVLAGTWQGDVIGLEYGGTNQNLSAVLGGIVYTDSNSMEVLAAGNIGE
ncbi:hypothetical protein KAJ89_04830, partial [Candidatus Parcubacteria bacterium]|nr:hypothetical protein [Candidatus Parcubacteria bacterium]